MGPFITPPFFFLCKDMESSNSDASLQRIPESWEPGGADVAGREGRSSVNR